MKYGIEGKRLYFVKCTVGIVVWGPDVESIGDYRDPEVARFQHQLPKFLSEEVKNYHVSATTGDEIVPLEDVDMGEVENFIGPADNWYPFGEPPEKFSEDSRKNWNLDNIVSTFLTLEEDSYDGKVAEIDGKKYKLTLMEE